MQKIKATISFEFTETDYFDYCGTKPESDDALRRFALQWAKNLIDSDNVKITIDKG